MPALTRGEVSNGELWKTHPVFDRYDVSDHGRVRSVRTRTRGRILTPYRSNRYGHMAVTVYADGVKKKAQIHSLVLEAHIGMAPLGMEACHENRTPSDNRLSNLRWDTRAANQRDKSTHGTVSGSRNPSAKLSEKEVVKIRKYLEAGESQRSIARRYKVSSTTIRMIANGKKWKGATCRH